MSLHHMTRIKPAITRLQFSNKERVCVISYFTSVCCYIQAQNRATSGTIGRKDLQSSLATYFSTNVS